MGWQPAGYHWPLFNVVSVTPFCVPVFHHRTLPLPAFHGGGGGKMHFCTLGISTWFLPCHETSYKQKRMTQIMIVFCQKIYVIIKRLEYWSQSHAKSVGDLVNDLLMSESLLFDLYFIRSILWYQLTKPLGHTKLDFNHSTTLACLPACSSHSTGLFAVYPHPSLLCSSDPNQTPRKMCPFSAIFRNFRSGCHKPLYTVTDL